MDHIKRHRNGADRDQGDDDGPWQQIEASDRKAERDAAKPDPGQHQPDQIKALRGPRC